MSTGALVIAVWLCGAVLVTALDRGTSCGGCSGGCSHMRWSTSILTGAGWPLIGVLAVALFVRRSLRGLR